MTLRKTLCGLIFLLPGAVLTASAGGGQDTGAARVTSQPAETAETPTTTSAPALNPQASPRRMMTHFLAAVRAAEQNPERWTDAVACLDTSQMDEEEAREQGVELAGKLGAIIEKMIALDTLKVAELPDNPAAPPPVIGREPLMLALERREADRRWRFSSSTVALVPKMYEQLSSGALKPPPPPEEAPQPAEPGEPVVPEALRSPQALVRNFLGALNAAKADPQQYETAIACLDLSQVDEELAEEQEAEYAEKLGDILRSHLATGRFKTEDLPDQPDAPSAIIGEGSLELLMVRQDDGRWQFAARTVAAVPQMHAVLTEPAQPVANGEEPAPPTPPEKKPVDLGVPEEYRSPRATMTAFITAMNENDLAAAVRCLDLSRLSELERETNARVLAGKLLLVMNRHQMVTFEDLPDVPDDDRPYKRLTSRYGRIEIDRQRSGERAGEWLFTTATVRSIEGLYDAWESRPLLPEFRDDIGVSVGSLPSLWLRERIIPAGLKQTGLWLQHWQWIGIALVLLLGLAVRQLGVLILPPIGRRLLRTEAAAVLPHVVRTALLPTATLAMVVAWWAGLKLLDLGAALMSWTSWFLLILITILAVVACYRLIDLFTAYFSGRAAATASRLDDVLVPLIHKTLKVVVVAVGLIFIAKMFGFKVTPLLAGLGVGGLAFGLAAQDTLKNFFGSVNVVLDRPFQVGDWVKIGDVEGTVESVGLRSSRVRTFYNSEVTVPNSAIMTSLIDNMGRRRYRRISCMLSVAYDTPPEKLEAFCEGIRELIRTHPYTRRDYYHCWVNKFAASSIDILLYCFHEAPDWGTELRERHRLFLDIIRLAGRLGVEFAFPTQTVHLHHDSSPPEPPPPPPAGVPPDSDGATQFGAAEAARIVHEAFGDQVERPPPVKY